MVQIGLVGHQNGLVIHTPNKYIVPMTRSFRSHLQATDRTKIQLWLIEDGIRFGDEGWKLRTCIPNLSPYVAHRKGHVKPWPWKGLALDRKVNLNAAWEMITYHRCHLYNQQRFSKWYKNSAYPENVQRLIWGKSSAKSNHHWSQKHHRDSTHGRTKIEG